MRSTQSLTKKPEVECTVQISHRRRFDEDLDDIRDRKPGCDSLGPLYRPSKVPKPRARNLTTSTKILVHFLNLCLKWYRGLFLP